MPKSLRRLVIAFGVVGAAGVLLAVRQVQNRDTRPCVEATINVAEPASLPRTSSVGGNLLVANQASGDASLIDLTTGDVTQIDVSGEPHDATISPDGRWGVVSDFGRHVGSVFTGNTLTVIDIARKTVVRTIETGEHRGLHDVAFRPGYPTRALVTAQSSREVLEIDVVTGEIVATMETRGDRSHLLAATRDGKTLFTTNEGSATVSRIDLETRRFVASFPATRDVEGIAVTSDGKELWVGQTSDSSVWVIDAVTGTRLARFPGFRHPNKIVSSPDGKRLLISDPTCGVLAVGDPATRRITQVIRGPYSHVWAGAFSPDGSIIFAAAGRRDVIAMDVEKGTPLARIRVGRWPDGMGWAPKPPSP
jgi:DNA-binding beta-propeller fold protein YncE